MFQKAKMLASELVTINTNDKTKLQNNNFICRPTELPIYMVTNSTNNENLENVSTLPNHLEEAIFIIRTELQSVYNFVRNKTVTYSNYTDIVKNRSQRAIEYLNESQSSLPRSGAITVGGAAGFIYGARGGIIKKLMYTSIGAGAIACICFPRQAGQQAEFVLNNGSEGIATAYKLIK